MNPVLSLRLLDANANRAREGIRTAEDYIRFQVGAERWALRLRDARRRIADALHVLASDEELLRARGVQTDAGHPGRAEPPAQGPAEEAPRQVALRGLKRAQEALRVLEEFTRGPAPDSSRTLARLRFELYEAEQWLGPRGGPLRGRAPDAGRPRREGDRRLHRARLQRLGELHARLPALDRRPAPDLPAHGRSRARPRERLSSQRAPGSVAIPPAISPARRESALACADTRPG